MSSIEEVAERLDGLERENRRLRGIAMALLAGALGLGALALFPRERGSRKVETQQLVLRDKEGRLRGSFGVDRDGLPSMKLYDHRGLEQVMLGVQSDDFSVLSLSNRGVTRVLLDSSIDGYTSLRLFDPDQGEKASLVLKPDSTVGLRLSNAHQTLRLGIAPDGQITMPTLDSPGDEVERFVPATRTSETGRDVSAATLASPLGPRVPGPAPRSDAAREVATERGERHWTRGLSQ